MLELTPSLQESFNKQKERVTNKSSLANYSVKLTLARAHSLVDVSRHGFNAEEKQFLLDTLCSTAQEKKIESFLFDSPILTSLLVEYLESNLVKEYVSAYLNVGFLLQERSAAGASEPPISLYEEELEEEVQA